MSLIALLVQFSKLNINIKKLTLNATHRVLKTNEKKHTKENKLKIK